MRYWLSLRGEDPSSIDPKIYGGVALLKSETIGKQTGLHITSPKRRLIIEDYLHQVCKRFHPKQVWYRLPCFASVTANTMVGNNHIFDEHTPFLGCLGTRRLQKFSDELEVETEMLYRMCHRWTNLGVLLPFVHDAVQVKWYKQILKSVGLACRLGSMIETPAAALSVQKIVKAGALFLVIGLNDLTSLVLGVARYQETVVNLYKRDHPSVVRLVQLAVSEANQLEIPIGIAGYIDHGTITTFLNIPLSFVAQYPK